VKIEKQEVQKVEDQGDPNGVEGGEVGGVAGGVVGGDINGVVGAPPPPPPPPPPPAPPQNVPPTLLEGSRIAGDKMIVPDDVTKTEIQRSGKDKIIGSFKLCITKFGDVSAVTMLKSSGFPAYDQKIQRGMQTWKYRPYVVNGKDVPVCTAVTFIYSQK
jgi:protein TonB